MNIAEIEKIKGLVRSSAILSVSERTEWLALLDSMSDKQLGELEKILASSQQSAVSNKQSAIKTITSPSPSLERRGMEQKT